MTILTDEATPAKPKKGAYGGHVDIMKFAGQRGRVGKIINSLKPAQDRY